MWSVLRGLAGKEATLPLIPSQCGKYQYLLDVRRTLHIGCVIPPISTFPCGSRMETAEIRALPPFLRIIPTDNSPPMARTPSEDLFQLIHSLNKNEKGYVKKFFARHVVGEENDYSRLYDAIERQESPDDKALRKELTGSPMLKRLPAVKNYLTQQILEAMRLYHTAKSPEREITELLLDADFLWEKSLYEMAIRRVRKAKEVAQRYDEFAFWLKTISWEKNYRGVIREVPNLDSGKDSLGEEQEHVIALMQSTIRYEHLGNTLHHYLLRHMAGDKEGKQWLLQLPKNPLIATNDQALSRPAKLNYHLIRSNWHAYVDHDVQAAAEHARAFLTMVDDEPDLVSARPDLEIMAVQTFLQRCVDAQMYDEYRSVANRLWNPEGGKPSRNIDVKRFYRAFTTELGFATSSEDTSRILDKLPYLRERYTQLRNDIPVQSRASCTFLAARICLEQRRVREAAWWLTETLAEDASIRTDLHVAARLLQLRMAHERRDRALLRSLERSLQRFLKHKAITSARLEAVLSYYRRLSDVRTDREVRKITEETIRRLSNTSANDVFDPVSSAGLDKLLTQQSKPKSHPVDSGLNY